MSARIVKEETIAGTYWYPAENTPEAVVMAVTWYPAEGGSRLSLVKYPFRSAKNGGAFLPMPKAYYNHTWASTKREADRKAREYLTWCIHCLRQNHGECTGHVANLDDWPDAPECPCAHGGAS